METLNISNKFFLGVERLKVSRNHFPDVEKLNNSDIFLGVKRLNFSRNNFPGVKGLNFSRKHFPGSETLNNSKKRIVWCGEIE